MDIRIGQIVCLSDNNKYIVASNTYYDNKNYYYVVRIEDDNKMPSVFRVFYEDKGYFVKEKNEEILSNVLPLLLENSKSFLEENDITD